MKTKMLSLVGLFLLGTTTLFAQATTGMFEVKGNCGMCESRIEKAANSVEGVTSADWNKETKIIEVVLDSTKTTVHLVQLAIADAGHDTPMHKAKDEVYNELPGCCQYDRSEPEKVKTGHEGHKH